MARDPATSGTLCRHFMSQGRLRATRTCHHAITLDTYSHAIPALQEEAATRIAALVLVGK